MNLEKVSVALRPRNPWEAIDLGLSLARANARVVWGAWAACVLPVHALLWLLLWRWPGLVFFLLWWLKPLFDRVPLAALSQLLFGGAPTPRSILRSLPRGLGPHLLRSLTLSRISPLRAIQLPVWQLEGLDSRDLARRQRVLTRGADSGAMGLMMVAGMIELCLTAAGTGLVMLLAPEDLSMDLEGLAGSLLAGEAPLWYTVSTFGCWTLAHSLAEPLFVAGGFGLYINRRTWLEGWDIELQFRRLARRLGATAALLLALLAWSAPALAQDSGYAPSPEPSAEQSADPEAPTSDDINVQIRQIGAEQAGPPVDAEAVQEQLDAVLALPEMPHTRTESSWQLKGKKEELDLPNVSLGPLAVVLGNVIKVLVIGTVVIGLLLLVRAIARARAEAGAPDADDTPAPTRLPALLRDAEPLPEDVVGRARALWHAGRRAEALGLLYRGALRHLVVERGLPIPDGATESDCLRLLRPQLQPDERIYFSTLTLIWQAAAYAHSLPEESTALGLMDQWPRWYREVP